jgi:O-antigen/teichoic acid export membrane protein
MYEGVMGFVRHRFVRDTLVLQAGSVGAVLVQAIIGIFLARQLGPSQFGVYALAASVASIASVFLGAGAVDAIAPIASRAWHVGDAPAMQRILAFLVRFIIAAAGVSVVLAVALPFITAQIYDTSQIGFFGAIILAAAVISSLGLAILSLGLQLAGRIRELSLLLFFDTSTRMLLALFLVSRGMGVQGAVAGHFIGASLVAGIVIGGWVWLRKGSVLWPSFRALLTTRHSIGWRENLPPTFWVLLDRNLAMLFGALPIALVGAFVSSADVAYFKIALGYILLAMSVFTPISTLLNVEFPKMQVAQPHRVRHNFIRISLYSLACSCGVTAIVVAVAPFIFKLLYGIHYLPAVPLVFGLALFGATYGIGVGLGPMWRALQRVRVSIAINIVTLGLGIPIGIVLIRNFHVWGAVFMITLWYVVSQLVSFFYLERYLKRLEKKEQIRYDTPL